MEPGVDIELRAPRMGAPSFFDPEVPADKDRVLPGF